MGNPGEVLLDEAKLFDCRRSDTRHPRETKGLDYRPTVTAQGGLCSGPDYCDPKQGAGQ